LAIVASASSPDRMISATWSSGRPARRSRSDSPPTIPAGGPAPAEIVPGRIPAARSFAAE
jgi:hypothetical protein